MYMLVNVADKTILLSVDGCINNATGRQQQTYNDDIHDPGINKHTLEALTLESTAVVRGAGKQTALLY